MMGRGVSPESSMSMLDGRGGEKKAENGPIRELRKDATNGSKQKAYDGPPARLPLVVALNCMDDCRAEAQALAGVAVVEHVGLAQVGEGKIEAAAAVLVQSIAYLPRAAQRRLQPWQLILSLGCADKAVDSDLATDLGLQLLHVDSGRSEEVADTAMALILGLLRRIPTLAAQAGASAGWLGALPAACRGMRRCRGLVLGIIGASASAYALTIRCLAFQMNVIYFDTEESNENRFHRRGFPPQARKVDNLQKLLSISDVVSLHCSLTNETIQIINAETIKFIKPGAVLVNTSSSHLLDDCALKEALIEGTLAGCALDGVEGPQWLEAWVREMPNVLILPKSADYSEEVWAEIRAKAVSVLRSFLLEGIVPTDMASDDEDNKKDFIWQKGTSEKVDKENNNIARTKDDEQQSACDPTNHNVKGTGKKGKKRTVRRKAAQQQLSGSLATLAVPESELSQQNLHRGDCCNRPSLKDAGATSLSRFSSPEETKAKREADGAPGGRRVVEFAQVVRHGIPKGTPAVALDYLNEGQIVALRAIAGDGYYVARQKGPGRGWRLDTMANVTCRDPAAQFLVIVRNRDRIGLRSLAAGGKLLQANKKLELVFVNHSFDVWESWIVEGATLEDCRLTNSKFRGVSLDVSVEILAVVGEEDGVARWLT